MAKRVTYGLVNSEPFPAYVSQESPLELTVNFGLFAGRETSRDDVDKLGEALLPLVSGGVRSVVRQGATAQWRTGWPKSSITKPDRRNWAGARKSANPRVSQNAGSTTRTFTDSTGHQWPWPSRLAPRARRYNQRPARALTGKRTPTGSKTSGERPPYPRGRGLKIPRDLEPQSEFPGHHVTAAKNALLPVTMRDRALDETARRV